MQKIIFIRFVQFLNLQKHITYLCFFLLVFLVTISSYSQVGIGTINPDSSSALDITSTNKGILIPRVSLDNVSTTMLDGTNTAATGLLIFNTNTAIVGGSGVGYYYFNGATWERLTTSASGDNTNTLDEAYDEGGAGAGKIITATDGAVTIAGEDGLLVTGTFGSGDAGPSGAGTKMFFNPNKAAFRAGYVDGTQWDNASLGFYSVAMGENSIASGNRSTALGGGTATEYHSIAMGRFATASAWFSLAIGLSTIASGEHSTTMGLHTTAKSYGETTLGVFSTDYTPTGINSWVSGDRLFVIGNGVNNSNRSNALTIYKNGLMNINDAYNMPLADGIANQVMQTDGSGNLSWVNSSNFEDHDFYEEGTTAAPNDINDDIFTQGNVAIGKNTADYTLDIESTGTRGIKTSVSGTDNSDIYGHYIQNSNSGTGQHYGNYIFVSGSGTGNRYGTYQRVSGIGSASSTFYGAYNYLPLGIGTRIGTRNYITDGVNNVIGTENRLEENAGSSAKICIGTRNTIDSDGSITTYGTYNTLGGFTGEGKQYGLYNSISNQGDNEHYGVYNLLTGSGTGVKYGTYTEISNTTGGTHYGLYSEVLKSGSYAGYFLGNVSIGTLTTNNYILPSSRGSNNQVMQTDGSGNVSWATLSFSDTTTASNGLTLSTNDVRLGGSLTQATTITQGAYNYTHNLSNTGDFIIQDAGTNVFEIGSNGISYFGDDTYWRDLNTGGTNIATLIDDGDDGRFQIYEDGNTAVDLDANTGFIFNEQGLDRDFRIEGDSETSLFRTDANNNRIGIMEATPNFDIHLKQSARFEGDAGGIGFEHPTNTNNWKIYNSGTNFSFAENGVRRAYISSGTGAYVPTSDRRLKKSITEVESILDKVNYLKTYRYLYIDQDISAKKTIGFMAQDVLPLFPELVEKAEDGYYGLNYAGFGVVAVKAIQEQQEEIEQLKAKNQELEARLARLEALLNH